MWKQWVISCACVASCLKSGSATSALEYDNNTLHIGIYGPFTTQPSLVAASIHLDLELGKTENPPKREFHSGCPPYGHSCNSSTGLIPPGITIPDRHPDLKVQLHFGDSNNRVEVGARTALEFAYGNPDLGIPPVNAVVGGVSSEVAQTVGSIYAVLEMVQVAYAAVSPTLSNKDIYPYFFRTATSVTQESGAIWMYVVQFQWRLVKVLYLSNDFGRAALDSLTSWAQEAGRASSLRGFGLPFSEVYDEPAVRSALSLVREAEGRLVLLFSNRPEIEVEVRNTMLAEGVCPPAYQIFSSVATRVLVNSEDAYLGWETWHTISLAPTIDANFLIGYTTFLYMSPEEILAGIEEYGMDKWAIPLDLSWFTIENLRDPQNLEDIVLGISGIGGCTFAVLTAASRMLHDGYTIPEIHGEPLMEYLKNVSFAGYGFPVGFDENQDGLLNFDIDYLESAPAGGTPVWVTFGKWDTAMGMPQNITFLPQAGVLWANGQVSWAVPDELVACPPGTFLDSTAGLCTECPAGRVSVDYDTVECSPCPAGSQSLNTTACKECGFGQFSLLGSAVCSDCPAGTFSGTGGTSVCENCHVGTYSSLDGQEECSRCDPGMFRGQLGGQECQDCPSGSYSDEVGKSACDLCPPGQFQQAEGQTACKACVPGTYTDQDGLAVCTPCAPGYHQPIANASEACTRCEVGKYSSSIASSSCDTCPYGTTPFPGTASVTSCGCPAGSFQVAELGLDPGCAICSEYMEDCPGFGQAEARQIQGYYIAVPSLEAYKCVSSDACPGGPLGFCPSGSSGRGCGSCEALEYYWNGRACKECGTSNTLLFLTLPVLGIVLVLTTHWLGNDPIKRSLSRTSEGVVLLGLNVTVFFYLSTAATLDVDWEEPVASILAFAQTFAIDATVDFACSLGSTPLTDFIISSTLPLVFILVGVVLGCMRFAKRRHLVNTFGTLINALFLLVVMQALKPLRYIIHPTGEKAVFSTPEVFEGSPEHFGLVVVSVLDLLFYCVGFIAACCWACWYLKRCSAYDRKRLMTGYRFLFYKFRPEANYWGLLVILRNTAFAVTPSLWPERPQIQVMLMSFIAQISAAHTSVVQPWKVWWMNVCDVVILLFLNLVLVLAMALLPEDASTAGRIATLVAICLGFVLAGMALPFVRSMYLAITAECNKEARQALLERFAQKENKFESKLDKVLSDGDKSTTMDDFESMLQDVMPASKPKRSPSNGSMTCLHPSLRRVSSTPVEKAKIARIASRIRDPSYTLLDFQEDCLSTFPELELYSVGEKALGTQVITGGRTAAEEELRTLGALFAVYWICRLDIDGKEGLAFGIDDHLGVVQKPSGNAKDEIAGLGWGSMKPNQRRVHFYYSFDWTLVANLFHQARITKVGQRGTEVDTSANGRLVSMLVLTAIHDIMKNDILCPKVEGKPYEGFSTGEIIYDHDMALAYLLDRHPSVLPSFACLTTDQKRVVRFTQSEMGFNAGWLVQAEGPPSAVLSKLKHVVEKDRAHNADIAFYFAHWLTDLAGAEPTPLAGTEKFAVKFPPHVLQSLLGCFDIVKELGDKSETEVYEEYMKKRWLQARDTLGAFPTGPDMPAKLRLQCMAQGAALQVLQAFDRIPAKDQQILRNEMSETGLLGQAFTSAGSHIPNAGTPFLLYYGPAWVQRAGPTKPELALRVLAGVYRLARDAWPESSVNKEQEELAGVGSRTVQVDLLKTLDLENIEMLFPIREDATRANPILQVYRRNDMEGVLEGFEYDV